MRLSSAMTLKPETIDDLSVGGGLFTSIWNFIIGGDLTASGGDIVFDALTTAKALTIKGAEGQGASIELWADEGDDTDADGGDKWQIEATTGNDLEFYEIVKNCISNNI